MVVQKGKPLMALKGIQCGECGKWIPVGVRIAGQKLCNILGSAKKTPCQKKSYPGGYKKKPSFINCDVCETRIDNPASRQIRCSGENGESSECDKIAAQEAKVKHKLKNKSVRREQLENAKKKICLRCGKKFPSTGAYNRICDPCARINENVRHTPVHSLSGYDSDLLV